MRTSYNNIPTFRAVLCTAFLLAVSIINCNAESPSDDMAPLARELRVIVDLYRLLSDKDLDNTLKEYVLINISVKGVATETGMAYDTDLKRAVNRLLKNGRFFA